jgi:hypothetical protein
MDIKKLKKLTAIIKGLDTFTSTDETRLHLCYIRAVSDTRLEATDGHRLAVVVVDGGHGLTPGKSYDGAQAVKQIAAGFDPSPVREDMSWPDTQACIDSADRDHKENKSNTTMHVSPLLLAEVTKGLVQACGVPRFATSAVRICFGDSFAPVRFDLSHNGVSAFALLMPVRT